ncbi:MAG TPA: glycogen debranching protein GlgX [Polyangiaceae bacterium]|nr:glycogen debranching protein GlgX [Polyangiaceae bacterium]
MRIWPGTAGRLGAIWDGEGVNFALFSRHATGVDLCLYDTDNPALETHRIPLTERTNRVWHCYSPDVRPGQLYAYRVHGPYVPARGHRFNANKVLLDPYARAIAGQLDWHDDLFGYKVGHPDADLSFDTADSAPYVPKCVVVDESFTWGNDARPNVPWSDTLIYEAHVKGMTMKHPDVPPNLRGTYLGLASDAILDHLKSLGVTAIELLPVHHFVVDRRLADLKLTNYWGYQTMGFFAPDPRYATGNRGQQVNEFKTMVKAFHREGIEVILDVVYNHTGEGNELGPTIGFRGVDNASYYRLVPHNERYYQDFTGCGNSWNVTSPRALQLVLDSLRHWVIDMHVDGFRFDLAPTLARDPFEFDGFSRFLSIVQQDPVLSQVKLIAEPWDLGPGGYRLGAFPPGWAEWNGSYRDSIRRFWKGDEGQVPELASRLSGSSDIFQSSDRGPYASINFVTCHDGYTLRDLVSYEQKHNHANGEDNRDGHDHNSSRNWGHEGETKAAWVNRMRERMMKNFFATLAFSQGVPMIGHGDELGRTQRGNNNAYCQDELSWIDWDLGPAQKELLAFVQKVFQISRSNPVFRRRKFFAADPTSDKGVKDILWIRPDGREMTDEDWKDAHNSMLGMLIHGFASDEMDERGRHVTGQTLLLFLNGSNRARATNLPELREPGYWHEIVNTAQPTHRIPKGTTLNVAPHSLVLLCYEGHE